MSTVDLSTIYASAHPAGAAVLRCTECPDWEVDTDGTALPTVIREAEDHVRDEHSGDQVEVGG